MISRAGLEKRREALQAGLNILLVAVLLLGVLLAASEFVLMAN
jgi:hypothetical protein